MTRAPVALSVFVALALGSVPAPGHAEVIRTELGRPFELEVPLEHKASERVVTGDALPLPPGVELLGVERRPIIAGEAGAPQGTTLHLRLALFDHRIRELGPMTFRIEGAQGALRTVQSPLVTVEPVSVIGDGLVPLETRGMRGLVTRDSRRGGVPLLPLALAGAAALLGLGLLLRRRVQERLEHGAAAGETGVGEVLAEPAEEALLHLEELEAGASIDSEDAKAAIVVLSGVMRRYLSRRFDLPSGDYTTLEIRSRLASVDADAGWKRSMHQWFERCDLIKFAGAVADPDEARELLYSARRLVERSRRLEREQKREVARA